MGNWAGDWNLVTTTNTHKDLKMPAGDSQFSLQSVPGSTGVYTVVPFNGNMTAAWTGCVLCERAGDVGPALPWPLPTVPTVTHLENAGGWLRSAIDKVWRSKKRYARLEGDVDVGGKKQGVVLFKVDQGLVGGKDMLIAVLQPDLDGYGSPDGSAVGTRRN